MDTFEQRLENETIKQFVDQCDSAEDLYSRGLIGAVVYYATYNMFVISTPVEKHYIAMAGLKGYLPNYCGSYDTTQDAYSALLDIHDIDYLDSIASELFLYGYADLDIHIHGNEYCEIIECDCDDPDQHNDN